MLVREIDLVVMRAVHRTQVEVLTLDIDGRIHVVLVVRQVPRAVVEVFLGDLRGRDAYIAVPLLLKGEELELLAYHHALGQPERQASSNLGREAEEPELGADLAVIALLRFLDLPKRG
jgi:hypothetical protein